MMPAPYGVTAQGFSRKSTQEILADIKARQLATISANLDLSTATPWGQNNGIVADELAAAWEVLEVCYHAFDPDQAEDFLQTSLAKLTGTERRAASYSLVTLTCDLYDGTTLTSGTHYAAVDGDATSLWTPLEDYTAVGDGDHDIVFRAELAGPERANAGTITVKHTAVVGWNSVTNDADADPGHAIDDDATLRERREAQLAASGSATIVAIRADLLELDGVESCTVVKNDSNSEVDGIPPHYIRAIVFDGETPSVANNLIAQTIFESAAAGIGTTGGTSGVAEDAEGITHTVWFSRPTQIPIYIATTVVSGPRWDDLGGATGFKEYLATELKTLHGAGQDVQYRLADSIALYHGGLRAGVTGVTAFTMGTAPSPVGTVDVPIDQDELATFDTANIAVTVT